MRDPELITAMNRDLGSGPLRKEREREDDKALSLFSLGNTMIRYRWRIIRWIVFGGTLAAIIVFSKPRLYSASGSFIPQGTDQGKSGLSALAGQLGVPISAVNQSLSPEFYIKVLKSRELLRGITHDTLVVRERGNRRIPFFELFDIDRGSAAQREEEGIRRLSKMISASATRTTGLVEFSVATAWPSVSVQIAMAAVNGVNEFNQRMRQEQAGSERKFVEARLAVASDDLRASEDRLETFLRNNRQFLSSPDLTFQRDRLQRDVSLKQQVFTSLTQSYEDVRLREVRDTPVITLVETPTLPTLPDPAGRIWSVILGILLGAFIGSVSALASDKMLRDRETGDPAAREFALTLSAIKGGVLGRVRGLSAKRES
jgi:uncharacterized protein involved in exopolysaccharide biosynthesis